MASAFFGSFLLSHVLPAVVRIMGVAVIVLELSMMGLIHIPFLMRWRRFDRARLPLGPEAAMAVGNTATGGWSGRHASDRS
jgi:cytochrome c biogenesis protein CcdA